MSRKHAREDVEDFGEVSEVGHASPKARIHGVVAMVSPIRKAKTCFYFDGKLSDGKKSMRVLHPSSKRYCCLVME